MVNRFVTEPNEVKPVSNTKVSTEIEYFADEDVLMLSFLHEKSEDKSRKINPENNKIDFIKRMYSLLYVLVASTMQMLQIVQYFAVCWHEI